MFRTHETNVNASPIDQIVMFFRNTGIECKSIYYHVKAVDYALRPLRTASGTRNSPERLFIVTATVEHIDGFSNQRKNFKLSLELWQPDI